MEKVENANKDINITVKSDTTFSKMIGNKTLGLLLMNSIGIILPSTEVHNTYINNFTIGDIYSENKWTRTAPAVKEPGGYSTERGSLSLESLMNKEVPSVLIQSEVEPLWAGSSIYEDGNILVEGVKGFGDEFMVGVKPPTELPDKVTEDITTLNKYIQTQFENHRISNKGYKLEWGWTEEYGVVVYQFNFINEVNFNQTIIKGGVRYMERYPTENGLEGLRNLIPKLDKGVGVMLVGEVGITSHFCDILRQWNIPSLLIPR